VRLFFAHFIIISHRLFFFWTGTLFLKQFKEASQLSAKQTEVFNQFSATFSPATIKKWELMITAWEANPKAPNPYEEPESGK
jgi:hypothetical protein